MRGEGEIWAERGEFEDQWIKRFAVVGLVYGFAIGLCVGLVLAGALA